MHVYDHERNEIVNISKQITILKKSRAKAIEELQKNCGHDAIIESLLPEKLRQNGETKIYICFICGTIFT